MADQTFDETFNEGLGHGGFVVSIRGQQYVFDPFNVANESATIVKRGALGQATEKAGVLTDRNATATVQLPVDGSNNPLPLLEGDSFTDPRGNDWWINGLSEEYASGSVWKMQVSCTQRLN